MASVSCSKLGSLCLIASVSLLSALSTGCASFRSFFALDPPAKRNQPIVNPFGNYNPAYAANQTMILRTKKGDRSVEIEIPRAAQDISDFSIPVSPAFRESSRGIASEGDSLEEGTRDRPPTQTDREITAGFPQGAPEDEAKRNEIERGLGLIPSETNVVDQNKSYLASLDQVKQLYRAGRYEKALLDTDDLLRTYQTDPRLHQMRGTLLDRLGRTELAVKAWNQALRFDPSNQGLRKFIERRQQRLGLTKQ